MTAVDGRHGNSEPGNLFHCENVQRLACKRIRLQIGRPCDPCQEKSAMDHDHLYILWTSDNPITAEKMVFMYAVNSMRRGWWQEVTLIIWGAPALLVAHNGDIQDKVQEALDAGVHLTACRACADQLGVTEKLRELGIAAEYWGQPLTELLQGGARLLTV